MLFVFEFDELVWHLVFCGLAIGYVRTYIWMSLVDVIGTGPRVYPLQ